MTRTNGKPDTGRNTQLLESAGTGYVLDGWGLDDDEHLYRRLTGSRGESLPSYQHEKMLGVSKYLYRSNPVAQRLVTLISDFVAGEGVSLSFRNSEVEAVISEHWDDPYNDWTRNGPELLEAFLLTGELLLPLFPDMNAGGHLRIGAEMVDNIREVHAEAQNWRVIERVVMRSETSAQEGITYNVVNIRDDREALEAEHPALFYKRQNPFGKRGMSILYPVADFLDLLDQFGFSEVERWMIQKAFIYDVTVNGADEARIDELSKLPKYAQPPKPSSVIIHNENETWEPKNPRIESADSTNAMRFLRNHIGGALGIPEHWYAEGGDVNRAVGAVMAEPVRKRMKRLQDEWQAVLTDVLKAQIDYAILAGRLSEEVTKENSEGEPTEEMISVYDAFDVNMPDISSADTNELATGLQMVVSAVGTATDEGLMSTETGQKLIALIAQQFGVEVDLQEEKERIAAEREQRERDRPDMPQGRVAPVPFQVRDEERDMERMAAGD